MDFVPETLALWEAGPGESRSSCSGQQGAGTVQVDVSLGSCVVEVVSSVISSSCRMLRVSLGDGHTNNGFVDHTSPPPPSLSSSLQQCELNRETGSY